MKMCLIHIFIRTVILRKPCTEPALAGWQAVFQALTYTTSIILIAFL